MTLALVHTRARAGVRAPAVDTEVFLAGGLPRMSLVGLPEAAVREAKDRVRAAILCAQYDFPARVITVNLSPADLPKDGGHGLHERYGRRWITSNSMARRRGHAELGISPPNTSPRGPRRGHGFMGSAS